MKVEIPFYRDCITLKIPSEAFLYSSQYPSEKSNLQETIFDSINNPYGTEALKKLVKKKKPGNLIIAVSDITRPIPYKEILPHVLDEIENCGIKKNEITILIATGMHRESTEEELVYMFGKEIVSSYSIIDHKAEFDTVKIQGKSYSGSDIFLNKIFIEASFKIIIGLVEPHFMAGFSGGRKTICPGLSSLKTIKTFHGYNFLSDIRATAGNLENNPCHKEAQSVAQKTQVDFNINIILNNKKKIVKIISGDLTLSHAEACKLVKKYACPKIIEETDALITGCGGYPLDATFYQCIKALVTSLPAVKKNGTIIALGGCVEGIGSGSYKNILKQYNNNFNNFLNDIKKSSTVIQDQWQIQMQCRIYEKIPIENIFFYTEGLEKIMSDYCGLKIYKASSKVIEEKLQKSIDLFTREKKTISIFPEGPYCTPVIL